MIMHLHVGPGSAGVLLVQNWLVCYYVKCRGRSLISKCVYLGPGLAVVLLIIYMYSKVLDQQVCLLVMVWQLCLFWSFVCWCD